MSYDATLGILWRIAI